MPIIPYACNCGHTDKKFVRRVSETPASILCSNCNSQMKRTLGRPASTSKISIDNGVQARAVEVNPDIIAINHERANKNYSEE